MDLAPITTKGFIDISGKRFGKLVVIQPAGRRIFKKGGSAIYFRCRCDCGSEYFTQRQNLEGGISSCGCDSPSRGTVGNAGVKHPLYSTWRKMIERCMAPSCPDYKNYGARGISIDRSWLTGDDRGGGLDCFISDMGDKPSKLHSLERRNNEKGYGPENCFWADRLTQSRNQRSNRNISYQGKTLTVSEWAEKYGLPYFTLIRRLNIGWDVDRALNAPIRGRNK